MNLGGYELVEEIGRGGFGLVFRARAPDGSEVAVKVLRSMTAERSARFDREIRLLRELGEGFVPLLAAGDAPDGPYLVMPFVKGGTLRDRLRLGPLSIEEAIDLARALAGALARAHERGIVHRDMKPENVLFTHRGAESGSWGRPLIADLGLGKHVVAAGAESIGLTKSNEIRGTPGYVAPEQVRQTREAGPPADVFALGAILYECLAGRAAFEAPNALAAIVMAENENFAPLAKERRNAPAWLVQAIERALAADPAARFPDARAFERALREPRERTASRRALAVAFVAVVAVAVGVSVAVALAVAPPPRPPTPPTDPQPPPDDRREHRGEVPGDPHVEPPPPAPVAFPAFCKGFLETPHTRLAQLLGAYEWTNAREVVAAAFSPEGRFAITGGSDAARIFEFPGGREVRVTDGPVSGVALAPDATLALLVTGARDRTSLTLWTADGRQELPLGSRPTSVAISTDGRRAIVGCANGSVGLHSLPSGELAEALPSHASPVLSVAMSPDGALAASVAEEGTAVLHGGTGSSTIASGAGSNWRVAFSPDGRHLLVQTDKTARVVDVRTRLVVRQHDARAKIAGSGFTARGDVFTVTGYDLRIWDRAEPEPVKLAVMPRACAVSRDGTRALLSSISSMRPFDLEARKELVTFEGHRSHVTTIAAIGSSSRILTAGYDGRIVVWQLATGRETAVLGEHQRIIYAVTVTPDGELALSAGADRRVKLWDVATGKLVREFTGHSNVVHAVAASPRGMGASAGLGARILLWDIATASILRPLAAARGVKDEDVNFLEFTEDDRLVSACTDGRLLLWNVGSDFEGPRARVIANLGEPLTAMAVSRARRIVLVGTGSGRLVAIELAQSDGTRLLDAKQQGAVFTAAISPDSSKVVSSGAGDSRIFLSDLGTGALLDTVDLASSQDAVHSVAWTPDGKSFLAGTLRGVVLRFEVR